jgi:hypothetical protein
MSALADQWAGYSAAFYAAATFGILLTGVFKGGFGGGPGGIAVALMSMFVAPADAAGIVLPILCAMDIFGLLAYRNNWSRHHVRVLVPGALLIGLIAVTFTLNRWFDLAQRLGAKAGKPGRLIGFLSGATSGLTSTMAHAGGPPLLVYLLPQRMEKTIFVGTSVVFFAIVNYLKLIPYGLLGQLSTNNLGLSLLFAPLAPLGIWLGLHLERRIPEKPFYRLSYAILFATGCKLIYDSLTA